MSGLQFPQDITQSGRYMTLRFSAYQRRTLNAPAVTQPISGDNTIRLPIPNDLVDSQRVQYNNQPLGTVVGSILESVVNSRGSRAGGITLENALNTASGVAAAGATAAALEAAVSAAGGGQSQGLISRATSNLNVPAGAVVSAISQYAGVGVNPFMSVSFETPTFKTHRFSWKLVPRDQVESNSIRSIVSTIKKAMLPGVRNIQAGGATVVGNNLLFDYPDIVEIFLTPNEYTYNFKRCVVESFNVNYAPGNAPAFYRGSNAPVAVDIVLELKEIEYWTKADYGGAQTAFPDLGSFFNLIPTQLPTPSTITRPVSPTRESTGGV